MKGWSAKAQMKREDRKQCSSNPMKEEKSADDRQTKLKRKGRFLRQYMLNKEITKGFRNMHALARRQYVNCEVYSILYRTSVLVREPYSCFEGRKFENTAVYVQHRRLSGHSFYSTLVTLIWHVAWQCTLSLFALEAWHFTGRLAYLADSFVWRHVRDPSLSHNPKCAHLRGYWEDLCREAQTKSNPNCQPAFWCEC